MKQEKYDAEVERGAILLDIEAPGWERLVNPDRLGISEHEDCILGQVFGSYDAGLDQLGLGSGSEHGFFPLSIHEYKKEAALLTEAWRRYLLRSKMRKLRHWVKRKYVCMFGEA